MSLRLYGTISGWGRSAGAVIPALGSGRYSPGPNIVLPSWLQGSDPHCTLNVFWGQPGALATVSFFRLFGVSSRLLGVNLKVVFIKYACWIIKRDSKYCLIAHILTFL